MTVEQAMIALKDAYERKANIEEMGYYAAPQGKQSILIGLMRWAKKRQCINADP
jgi:hypothetical protein